MEKPEWKRPLGRPRHRWVDNINNIKVDLREREREREVGVVWTWLIWLRIGNSGGLLWKRKWTFRFHKMLGSSSVAAQLAASQEGLSSMKLVWNIFEGVIRWWHSTYAMSINLLYFIFKTWCEPESSHWSYAEYTGFVYCKVTYPNMPLDTRSLVNLLYQS
jgi:hypothetical protein